MKGSRIVSGIRNSIRWALAAVAVVALASPASAGQRHGKLDRALNGRADGPGSSRVIITTVTAGGADAEVTRLGGRLGRRLALINGVVADVPNGLLRRASPASSAASSSDAPSGSASGRASGISARSSTRCTFIFSSSGALEYVKRTNGSSPVLVTV